jgi:hypothetical protein
MNLKVIDSESKLIAINEATVVLESEDYDDLLSKEAAELASDRGLSLGLAIARLTRRDGPYPVRQDGKPIETHEDVEQFNKDRLVYGNQLKFRCDYHLLHVYP